MFFNRRLILVNFRQFGAIFAQSTIGAKSITSSAGTGKNCALSMRVPIPSPALDKNRAPVGPEILSSTGAGVWRKAFKGNPDSRSVLDKFQSAILSSVNCLC